MLEILVGLSLAVNLVAVLLLARFYIETRDRLSILYDHVTRVGSISNGAEDEALEKLERIESDLEMQRDRMDKMWQDLNSKHGFLWRKLGIDPFEFLDSDRR